MFFFFNLLWIIHLCISSPNFLFSPQPKSYFVNACYRPLPLVNSFNLALVGVTPPRDYIFLKTFVDKYLLYFKMYFIIFYSIGLSVIGYCSDLHLKETA